MEQNVDLVVRVYDADGNSIPFSSVGNGAPFSPVESAHSSSPYPDDLRARAVEILEEVRTSVRARSSGLDVVDRLIWVAYGLRDIANDIAYDIATYDLGVDDDVAT